MSEDIDNLTLLHLRSLRAEIAKLSEYVYTLSVEMTALRQRVAAIGTLQDHDHSEIASLQHRLDRIERRLELID